MSKDRVFASVVVGAVGISAIGAFAVDTVYYIKSMKKKLENDEKYGDYLEEELKAAKIRSEREAATLEEFVNSHKKPVEAMEPDTKEDGAE